MIRVTMTETVRYDVEFEDEEFAELLGLDPAEESDLLKTIDDTISASPDSTYGIENTPELLEAMFGAQRSKEVAVEDREWEFDIEGLAKVPEGVKAPRPLPGDEEDWG